MYVTMKIVFCFPVELRATLGQASSCGSEGGIYVPVGNCHDTLLQVEETQFFPTPKSFASWLAAPFGNLYLPAGKTMAGYNTQSEFVARMVGKQATRHTV